MRSFEKVTRECHPAVRDIFAFLDSLVMKDKRAFAASFGASIFANLPGGVQVKSTQRLIEMHKEFLDSSVSLFEYGDLTNGIGGSEFFMCSVPAFVTLPDGKQRRVCIDVTFCKGDGSHWVPVRLINTVVDSAQSVLV